MISYSYCDITTTYIPHVKSNVEAHENDQELWICLIEEKSHQPHKLCTFLIFEARICSEHGDQMFTSSEIISKWPWLQYNEKTSWYYINQVLQILYLV